MNGEIYWFGAEATWALAALCWILITGHVLYVYAEAFVHDEKVKGVPNKFIYEMWKSLKYERHSGGDTLAVLLIGFCAGLVGGLVWPIAWPAAFCIGALRGTRTYVRFQKSYKAHKHDKETGWIA